MRRQVMLGLGHAIWAEAHTKGESQVAAFGFCGTSAICYCRSPYRGPRNIMNRQIVLLCAALAGCQSTKPVDEPVGYERGAWWRKPQKLNDARLAVAHLLFAHTESRQDGSTLWAPEEPPSRSKTEALTLAQETLRLLRKDPSRFGELARKRSNDASTAPFGGVIGVVNPPSLPDELVDALLAIGEGEISRVVESPLGYHIVRRDPLPPEERISARQVLILYRGAEGHPRSEREVTRSREEAAALAQRIATEARAAPERFASLVEKYSDGREACLAGDLGAWTPQDILREPLVTHLLAKATVGSIVGPVETRSGFHVLLRTGDTQRQKLAASEVVVTFGPRTKPPRTREEAKALADSLTARLAMAPSDFDALALEYCRTVECRNKGQLVPWEDGRGDPEINGAIRALGIGSITPVAVETPFAFHILRRSDPKAYQPPPPPSADELIAQVAATHRPQAVYFLAGRLELFAADAIIELGLDAPQAKKLTSSVNRLADDLRRSDTSGILELNERFSEETRRNFPPNLAHRIFAFRDEWARRPSFRNGLDPMALPRQPEQRAAFFAALTNDAAHALSLSRSETKSFRLVMKGFADAMMGATPETESRLAIDAQQDLASVLGAVRFRRYLDFQGRWIEEWKAHASGAPGN